MYQDILLKVGVQNPIFPRGKALKKSRTFCWKNQQKKSKKSKKSIRKSRTLFFQVLYPSDFPVLTHSPTIFHQFPPNIFPISTIKILRERATLLVFKALFFRLSKRILAFWGILFYLKFQDLYKGFAFKIWQGNLREMAENIYDDLEVGVQ